MKIIVIGQNGSGKTTLARHISSKQSVPLLEIDTIWHAMGIPSIQKSDETRQKRIKDHITNKITQFINQNQNWVCEGFYASALKPAADVADQIIFLDIPLWRRQLNHIKRTIKLENGVISL